MKVKLLKKIRKDFEIFRVNELVSNAPSYKIDAAKELGLPFYILYDKKYEENYYYGIITPDIFKTFQDAKDDMLDTILKRYKEKFRHKEGKEEKVWYNK